MYFNGLRSGLLTQVDKKSSHSNLPPGELKALEQLQQAQRSGLIQIKPADKGGGITIMNTQDYVKEVDESLKAIFSHEGVNIPFYTKASERQLKEKQKEIKEIVDVGVKNNFISPSDQKEMQPNGVEGRLYGLAKVHKKTPLERDCPHSDPSSVTVVPILNQFHNS